jgi:phage shock protein A
LQKMKSRSAKRKKALENKIMAFDEKIKKAGENAKDKLRANRKKLEEKLAIANAKLDWVFA